MSCFEQATFMIKNGIIHTLEGRTVSAMGVSNGRIMALGNEHEVSKAMPLGSEIIDLHGKTVFPGFNDSHMHLISYGFQRSKVCLEKLESVEALVNAGKQHLELNLLDSDQWLEGWGWNQNYFANPSLPTKSDLDQISTEVPIIFTRICCHMAVVNSKALEQVALQLGDAFNHDLLLDGILREDELDVFSACMPKPTKPMIRQAVLAAIDDAVAQGLTSVQTSDLHALAYDDVVGVYEALAAENLLKLRINLQLYLPKVTQLKAYVDRLQDTEHKTVESEFFKLGPVKLLLDGSLGARTAALRCGYSDDGDNTGLLTYTSEELEELVCMAHLNGLQLSLHAIGDRTLDEALKALEKAFEAESLTLEKVSSNLKRREPRHRINHCQIADLEQMEKMSALGVMGDVQPIFVSSDWSMVVERIGEERAKYSYAWKSLKDKGVKLAGGSDCPIEPFNPLWGIDAAVNRTDLKNNPPGGWHPEEKMTLDEALEMFTLGPAYATFEEQLKGTLAVGKVADFIVLSQDPYEVKNCELKELKVLATFVNGKAVYGLL